MLAWWKRVPQPPGRPGGHQMPIRESPNARALSGCLIPYRSHHVGHIILVGWLAVRGSLKTRRAHKRAQTTGGMWCAQAGNKPRPTWKLARADTARGHRGRTQRADTEGTACGMAWQASRRALQVFADEEEVRQWRPTSRTSGVALIARYSCAIPRRCGRFWSPRDSGMTM